MRFIDLQQKNRKEFGASFTLNTGTSFLSDGRPCSIFNLKVYLLICLAYLVVGGFDVVFGNENRSSETSLIEFYDEGKLFEADSYPVIRKIIAQKIGDVFRETVEMEWGKPSDSFVQWIERHPDLLEEFLTALDLDRDDIPAALSLMKRLCTEHPDKVEKYPGLAIALSVVWDQPDSPGFAHDSREQFKAVPPKNMAKAMDNFLFYTQEDHPATKSLRQLPWEFLVYVVCNKRSLEERKWVFENYKDEKNAPGKAYKDVPYNQDELKPTVRPALDGKHYSLSNIRQYGGVCSAQTDFALPVGRTLGIPTFYGGAGYPKYLRGHAWPMWLDIKEVKDNAVDFDFKEEGRGNPRFFIAGYGNPQTGLLETDESLRLRFHRAGKDVRAFRHAKLLMRSYRHLLEAKKMAVDERLEFLLAVNAISPKNPEAWRKIAALGKNRLFTVEHRQTVQDLARQMREELTGFPNELPALTTELVNFPEMWSNAWDGDRWEAFEPLLKMFENPMRLDLIIETMIDFNRIRVAELRQKRDEIGPTNSAMRHQTDHRDRRNIGNAVFMLRNLALRFAEEVSFVEPVFDELESVTELSGYGLAGSLDGFYTDYLKRLKSDGGWKTLKLAGDDSMSKEFYRNLFKRILLYSRKYGDDDLAREMKEELEKLDASDKKSDE